MQSNIPVVLIKLIKSYIPRKCYSENCTEIGSKLYIPNVFEADPWYDRCYCCPTHYLTIREFFRYY